MAPMYWQLINAVGGGEAIKRVVPDQLKGIVGLLTNPVGTLMQNMPGAQERKEDTQAAKDAWIGALKDLINPDPMKEYTREQGTGELTPSDIQATPDQYKPQTYTPEEMYLRQQMTNANELPFEQARTALQNIANTPQPTNEELLQGPPTQDMADFTTENAAADMFENYPASQDYFSSYARGGVVMPAHYSQGGWRLI